MCQSSKCLQKGWKNPSRILVPVCYRASKIQFDAFANRTKYFCHKKKHSCDHASEVQSDSCTLSDTHLKDQFLFDISGVLSSVLCLRGFVKKKCRLCSVLWCQKGKDRKDRVNLSRSKVYLLLCFWKLRKLLGKRYCWLMHSRCKCQTLFSFL